MTDPRSTFCLLHFTGLIPSKPDDHEYPFSRVPCIGEDIEVGSDTWRVWRVIWADTPVLHLSKVVE